jgi:[histone H3]-trimethyl-L-lysine4 demethylase
VLNLTVKGTRTNLNYLDQLAKFHKQYGTNLNRFPSVDKRPLDLYKLKKAVEVRGGFEKVCKDKKWAEIGRDLGYSGKIMSSLSTSLKNSYQRWLHPYEEYLRTVKPGVQQQLDFEYGGGFSPTPAISPMKRVISQSKSDVLASDSPAMQASTALNASISQGEPIVQSAPPPALPVTKIETPRPSAAGFMAVNSGGFSAINAPSGFVAVNHAQPTLSKRDGEKRDGDVCTTIATSNGHAPTPVARSVSSSKPSHESSAPTVNGDIGSNPLKRTMSHDSMNFESGSDGVNGDGDGANGRRSKRLKKGMFCILRSPHSLFSILHSFGSFGFLAGTDFHNRQRSNSRRKPHESDATIYSSDSLQNRCEEIGRGMLDIVS